MRDCGAAVEEVRAGKASLDARSIKAWVELHIEQAPQLIEAGMAFAVGTGVPGNFRYPHVTIRGEYAHVGLPRRFRHDAVLAASEFAVALDELWKGRDAEGRPMAFTIGRFHTNPNEHALTKVAGEMSLSLDVRAYDKAHLAELEADVVSLARQVAERRGVEIDLGSRASADVAPSDAEVVAALMAAAAQLAIPTMPLASPASHDTATFAVAGIPTAMLFVRNRNGSHNPREFMEIDDFLQAVAVLTCWLAVAAGAISL
jgi:N-carbamoyl-L-amino-acid hydrolase